MILPGVPACPVCSASGQRAQVAGDRCRRRDGSGDPCPGRLEMPFRLRCVGCDRDQLRVGTPTDPSTVLRCRKCGGRLASVADLDPLPERST